MLGSMAAATVFLRGIGVLDIGSGLQLLNEGRELDVLGFLDHALADSIFDLLKGNRFGWATAKKGADVESELGGEDRTDFSLTHGKGDRLELLHEFAALEPAQVDHLLLIQTMLLRELHEVFPGEQFLADAAHGLEDVFSAGGPLQTFGDVRGVDGLLTHVVPQMVDVEGAHLILTRIWIGSIDLGEHLVQTNPVGDIFTHDGFIFVGHADAHVELSFPTRLVDEACESGGDGLFVHLRHTALGLLVKQDTRQNVILGITAEFRVALATGDLELALVVPFDVAEFRFDDLVVDLFTIDDQCHGRMGRQSGPFCNQEPQALAVFFFS